MKRKNGFPFCLVFLFVLPVLFYPAGFAAEKPGDSEVDRSL